MTDYVSNEFVAFYFQDERTSEQALKRAVEQIEEHTPYRVCDMWLSPQRRIAVLNLLPGRPDDAPLPFSSRLKSAWLSALPHTNRLRVRGRMAILQAGYTTSAERRFERSIREAGEGLACDDAGGIAAFCVARFDGSHDERLWFWSTRPGLRTIASADSAEAVVIGTRPRLVHALTRAFRAPDLLRLTDGFFATEPRHLAFPVGSLVGDVGPGLVIGHIELQKGGWANNIRQSRASVIDTCKKRMTRWRDAVAPELTDAARRQVDEYVGTLPEAESAEYGYWINYRFRVCRWLTSHYLSHSKVNLPVYPLVDEKVTRIVSCAPLAHLVTERLLAETTWDLAPSLRDVPLFGDPYRFIQHRDEQERKKREQGAAAAPSSPPAATRVEPPAQSEAQTQAEAQAQASEANTRPPASASETKPSTVPAKKHFVNERDAREACEHIQAGKLREELRSLTQPHVWQAFVNPTHANMVASGMDGQRFTELLWTYYQASVLFTEGPDAW